MKRTTRGQLRDEAAKFGGKLQHDNFPHGERIFYVYAPKGRVWRSEGVPVLIERGYPDSCPAAMRPGASFSHCYDALIQRMSEGTRQMTNGEFELFELDQ